jgi:hypothetical protein
VLSLVDHETTQFENPSWVADLGRAARTWKFTKYEPGSPYKLPCFSPIPFLDDLQIFHVAGFGINMVEVDSY